MKKLCIVTCVCLLVACSVTPPPTSMLDSDWNMFGYDRAMKGSVIQSKSTLMSLTSDGELKSENYQAYVTGYEQGQEEYCSQNPFILGVKGENYQGICDAISWNFRQDYNSGRFSTAGGSY